MTSAALAPKQGTRRTSGTQRSRQAGDRRRPSASTHKIECVRLLGRAEIESTAIDGDEPSVTVGAVPGFGVTTHKTEPFN